MTQTFLQRLSLGAMHTTEKQNTHQASGNIQIHRDPRKHIKFDQM
jgi:hypothetical protein